jgi:hypothetical protein
VPYVEIYEHKTDKLIASFFFSENIDMMSMFNLAWHKAIDENLICIDAVKSEYLFQITRNKKSPAGQEWK